MLCLRVFLVCVLCFLATSAWDTIKGLDVPEGDELAELKFAVEVLLGLIERLSQMSPTNRTEALSKIMERLFNATSGNLS
ncbi:hypothetical protein AAHC03_018961 [Spirometra sp. Aus1]